MTLSDPAPPQPTQRPESRLAMQGRVLFALVMREMATRYGRSSGGYVWAILDPAATIALLSFVFSQIARTPPLGHSFPLFFATGYMAFHIYRDVSDQVSNSVQVNLALLSFPRVTLLDTVLARFILQVMTATLAATLIIGALVFWSGDTVALDFGAILLSVGLAALLALGVGALNCVLFAYSQTWKRAFSLLNRPLFIISGIFMLYEAVPAGAQAVLWWNPLVHVTALMRAGFYPTYEPTFVSPVYVMLFALAPLALGVLLLRVLKARMLDQ